MRVVIKSIPVRYNGDRYLKGEELVINDKHFNGDLFEQVEVESVDYSSLSAEELQKVKNDDLKTYLDNQGIAYESKATKDDLIKAILGGE